MKKLIFIFLLSLFLYSCSKNGENTSNIYSGNIIKEELGNKNKEDEYINISLSGSSILEKDIQIENKQQDSHCNVTLLSPYPTKEYLYGDDLMYANLIRVFSMKISDCKENELNLGNGVYISLHTGLNMDIIDTATNSFGSSMGIKDIKSEKISSLSEITLGEKCRENLDSGEDECFGKGIIGNFGSLIFTVNSGLTENNMYEVYDEVKTILQSIEEKESIKPFFNKAKVNLSATSVVGNNIILKDFQGIEKQIPISFQIFKDGTFQDVLSQMDVEFSKIEGNNLYINVFYGNAMRGFTYYNIIVDIDSGKTIKFETTYEDPEY